MPDSAQIRDQVISASQFMSGEDNAALAALFRWLPRPDITITVLDTAAVTSTAVAIASNANLIALEVTSPSGAANPTCVQIFDVDAAAVTSGTTIPKLSVKVPAAGRVTVPCFAFEGSKNGYGLGSAASFNAVVTNLTTNPAAADRPNVRILYTT